MAYVLPSFFKTLNGNLRNFLQYNLGWTRLNKVQEEAIPLILNQKDTLIISPTASGKTEAALIPVFNDILENDLQPMSVLYISPLKALINDMQDRIEDWSKEFSLTSTRWHGDVSASTKNKFIKEPTDFLSITPESLEVILLNRNDEDKKKIFRNVRYIIVDEIHYFIESERGIQLNSILNRISEYFDYEPVKIGLSATVGNPNEVAKWLDYENPAEIVKIDENPNFEYKVFSPGKLIPRLKWLKENHRKALVFLQSRAGVESLNQDLRNELNYENILIHHSSIDRLEKEYNEKEFKKLDHGFMISTSTLELGIDIGNINSVIMSGAPNTVSSFMQRMGRSGRRGEKSSVEIFFNSTKDIFLSVALICLGKENDVEDVKSSNKPFDIYFHQILSTVLTKEEIHTRDLYFYLKNCYVFNDITQEEYMALIRHMVKTEFLNSHNRVYLNAGYNTEKKFGKNNYFEFYSVFCASEEFLVKNAKKEIGSVDVAYALILNEGQEFILSGQRWQIKSIDYKKHVVQVIKSLSSNTEIPSWSSDSPHLSYKLCRKIHSILLNDFDRTILDHGDSYFDEVSTSILNSEIKNAKVNDFTYDAIPVEHDESKGIIYIYTFAGDKANILLKLILDQYFDLYYVNITSLFISFKIRDGYNFKKLKKIFEDIPNILNDNQTKVDIVNSMGTYYKNKFLNYLPDEYIVKMTFDLLFDEENLVVLAKDYQLVECDNSNIKTWF